MEKVLKFGLYSPYVPEHCGGGERYFFSVAEILSKYCQVIVLIRSAFQEQEIRQKYEQAFGFDLSKVKFQRTSLGTHASGWTKLKETAGFDGVYYLTDGSLFWSLARRNVLHIQFPFATFGQSLLHRLKMLNWQVKNTNSEFTKKNIEKSWHTRISEVHYPYVDTSVFLPSPEKQNVILSVGRFFDGEKSAMHCKRQDVLVEVFRKLVDEGLTDWKLVLVGSIDPGQNNKEYADKVWQRAKGYPIKIIHDASLDLIRQYYAKSKVYWHATGFGVDQNVWPTRVEHFGIAPIEAMASGSVPILMNKGGLPEIIGSSGCGSLWETEQELAEQTMHAIRNPNELQEKAILARKRSMNFSKERFTQTLRRMTNV